MKGTYPQELAGTNPSIAAVCTRFSRATVPTATYFPLTAASTLKELLDGSESIQYLSNGRWEMTYSNRDSLPLMRAAVVVTTTRHVAAWTVKGVGMFTAGLSRVGTKRLRIRGSVVGKASSLRWSEVGRIDHRLGRPEWMRLALVLLSPTVFAHNAMVLHADFASAQFRTISGLSPLRTHQNNDQVCPISSVYQTSPGITNVDGSRTFFIEGKLGTVH